LAASFLRSIPESWMTSPTCALQEGGRSTARRRIPGIGLRRRGLSRGQGPRFPGAATSTTHKPRAYDISRRHIVNMRSRIWYFSKKPLDNCRFILDIMVGERQQSIIDQDLSPQGNQGISLGGSGVIMHLPITWQCLNELKPDAHKKGGKYVFDSGKFRK